MSLKSYLMLTLTHLASSQFISANRHHVVRFQYVQFNSQMKRKKLINYVYLWFFTGQLPVSTKSYVSSKNNPFLKLNVKKKYYSVPLKKRKIFVFFQYLVKNLISKQITSEKKVWSFYRHYVNIDIPITIITHRTAFLQAKNNYFPRISLELRLQFSNSTAFEKLFLLRGLKILNPHQKIKNLEYHD